MDRLLRRIRNALRDADRPEAPAGPPPSAVLRATDPIECFTAALEGASGRVVRVESEEEALAFLDREFADRRVVHLSDEPSEENLRAADVGVDRADLLLAETGTVVRSYESRVASRISLVPSVSVFLGRESDIVPGLPEMFEHIADRHRAGRAYTILITGPSRTADIEKQLVIPAHGPRELLVLLHP